MRNATEKGSQPGHALLKITRIIIRYTCRTTYCDVISLIYVQLYRQYILNSTTFSIYVYIFVVPRPKIVLTVRSCFIDQQETLLYNQYVVARLLQPENPQRYNFIQFQFRLIFGHINKQTKGSAQC